MRAQLTAALLTTWLALPHPVGIVFEAHDVDRPHVRLAIKRVTLRLEPRLRHCLTRAEQAECISKLVTREVSGKPTQRFQSLRPAPWLRAGSSQVWALLLGHRYT